MIIGGDYSDGLEDGPAIRLQDGFAYGRSGISNTYGNVMLCGEAVMGDFEVEDFEVWGFDYEEII